MHIYSFFLWFYIIDNIIPKRILRITGKYWESDDQIFFTLLKILLKVIFEEIKKFTIINMLFDYSLFFNHILNVYLYLL